MTSDVPSSEQIERLAGFVRRSRHVVVLTGAGISAESGLRTFRGATAEDLPADMRALWADFDPQKLATPEAFEADPAGVSRWYDWRRLGCLAAEPNPGHLALAAMQRSVEGRGGRFMLLTQNVDRLHQRAGSTGVVELHGTILDWRCTRTGRRVTPDPGPMERFPAPSPHAAGAILRPDVVWFGEALPEEAVLAASEAAEACDLFISVGTSAVVYPAAGFIQLAKARGALTAEVNAEATPISGLVDCTIRGRAAAVLPGVVERI